MPKQQFICIEKAKQFHEKNNNKQTIFTGFVKARLLTKKITLNLNNLHGDKNVDSRNTMLQLELCPLNIYNRSADDHLDSTIFVLCQCNLSCKAVGSRVDMTYLDFQQHFHVLTFNIVFFLVSFDLVLKSWNFLNQILQAFV